MSRWYEHPCTNKLLEGEQVLTVLNFINEAKDSFKKHYGDPNSKESPLDSILKLWPDKSSIKREWLRRVLDNGPMNDKIQSMGTVISEFPMHSLFYLDSLISLVNFNKKRFAIISSDLLTSIFVTYLLPKGRPLININERPLSMLIDMTSKGSNKKKAGREKILSYWYFEEQLKVRYVRFLSALEELLKNEPDKVNKIKIINLCYALSQTKENQTLIFDMLVNKLGDLDSKVTGRAFSKLTEISFKNHVLMPKIVRAVRKFVFRPNLSKKAQYYAIQLLAHCQINKKHLQSAPLEPIDDETGTSTGNIAVELIQIYIGIFKRLIEGSKSKCEKLYSALLKGLSRAMPYTKGVDVQKYTNSVFELVHLSNLNLSIHGLKVLYSIVTSQPETTGETDQGKDNFDRYMRLVYSTVLNPSVFFNSQKVSLVDIFFKSVATDTDAARVKAMIKRLLQLCLHHPEPGFICVCLLFLSRLTNSKHQSIFEKKNVSKSESDLKMPTVNSGETFAVDSDDSGDEVLPDIKSDDEEIAADVEEVPASETTTATTSWIHYENQGKIVTKEAFYDAFARNPKYANAEREHLVELDMLKNHYHPSVRIFTEKIFNMERIDYKTDPSEDLSMTKFLDKFAYKNPKKIEDKRKHHPAATGKQHKDDVRQMAVNSKEFADLSENRVPGDQLFFHKYFNHAKQNKSSKKPADEIDSDFNDSDTEFDEYLMHSGKMADDLFASGSEMGDMDEDFDLSGLEDDDDDDDNDAVGLEDGDHMSVDEEGDSVAEEDHDDDDKEAVIPEEEEDDDEIDVDMDDSEMGESDDEQDSDEETIHSSKRKRLGIEMSNITTGALTMGKTFEKIKDKAANQIKRDRKRRKIAKNKAAGPKINNKLKSGKRRFKK